MQRFGTLAGLLAFTTSGLAAQATITGVIREDSTRARLPGVEVVVQALDRKATTDAAGQFSMDALAHGVHVILVRAIGYQPVRLQAYLVANDTLTVELRMKKSVVELAPLEVTASAVPSGLREFEERRTLGEGEFIDWTRLRKEEFRRTSDLFRGISGVRINYFPSGQGFLSSLRTGCNMQIVLDGIPIYRPEVGGAPPPSIDLWSIVNLDAIEVYRGPATTPEKFRGVGAKCGTVVLWSRRH